MNIPYVSLIHYLLIGILSYAHAVRGVVKGGAEMTSLSIFAIYGSSKTIYGKN